jgi:hypothetical protein
VLIDNIIRLGEQYKGLKDELNKIQVVIQFLCAERCNFSIKVLSRHFPLETPTLLTEDKYKEKLLEILRLMENDVKIKKAEIKAKLEK